MKFRYLALLLAAALLPAGCARTGAESGGASSAASAPDTSTVSDGTTSLEPFLNCTQPPDAPDIYVYLGVKDYGSAGVNKDTKPDFRYRFFLGGEEMVLPMDNGEKTAGGGFAYTVQNRLKEGSLYILQKDGDTVTDAHEVSEMDPGVYIGQVEALTEESITVNGTTLPLAKDARIWRVKSKAGGAQVKKTSLSKGNQVVVLLRGEEVGTVYRVPRSDSYAPPVSGTPGQRTLKNFLATALMPVGTTLYLYGGGWDWQDQGSSLQASSIGISPDWVRFFRQQDGDYTYKAADPARSYYPFGEWNEYYYAGLDCSGYLGWTLYNTMHSRDGEEGYVGKSTDFAYRLSQRGWGSLSQARAAAVKPGDVVSLQGHVWISLGTCPDGSVLILHSSPTESRSGQPGGGPQLSAIGGSRNCEAWRLADRYMSAYYPDWYERYPVSLKGSAYFSGASCFSWNLTGEHGGLTDPDGCRDMTPAELLADLFPDASAEN